VHVHQRFSSISRRPAVAGGLAVIALGAAALVRPSVAAATPTSGSGSSGASGAVSYAGVKAAESAFQAAGPLADPVACQRPAPDNQVSAYVHCYAPDQLRTLYGLKPLTASTTDGAGQTIVLVDSYGSPTAAQDLAFFAKTLGGPAPNFEQVFPGGTPNTAGATGKGKGTSGPTAAEGWAGEATLDIERAYAIAPKAHIVLIGTNPGRDARRPGPARPHEGDRLGINTYPSGTVFSMSFGTDESWAGIATGGGLSTVYSRPAYQNGVANVVGSHRGVPDLSWNAAVNGGVLVYRSFFPALDGPPSWAVYGGTSAGSPQAAAMTAIANQARAALGKKPIGDLNAAIYSTSVDKTAAFRGIVPIKDGTAPSGYLHNNQIWDTDADGNVVPDAVPGYPTTAGYDLTTGWGSPLAPGYVSQLAALT